IYELRVWMHHARLYNITCDEIRTAVWYELGRRNLQVPFPIRSLAVRESNVPEALVSSRGKAVEILRGGSALSCLTEEEATGLVKNGRLLLFGPNEALVSRGDAGDSMFVILEGGVEVVGKTTEGSRTVLARLGAGECFGEMSLMTGEPRNATVRAEEDVLVLEIRKRDISPLMAASGELAERLGDLLETRMKHWTESMTRAEANAPAGGEAYGGARSLVKRIREFFAPAGGG
ncbi:MAG: cyclic nucleotide-binding domain-containing protein, partial [Armatimonadetes bacterium]|nr:cyclic nucleotide-binding domain-containing protein [Akkermansiaceae bacterium]